MLTISMRKNSNNTPLCMPMSRSHLKDIIGTFQHKIQSLNKILNFHFFKFRFKFSVPQNHEQLWTSLIQTRLDGCVYALKQNVLTFIKISSLCLPIIAFEQIKSCILLKCSVFHRYKETDNQQGTMALWVSVSCASSGGLWFELRRLLLLLLVEKRKGKDKRKEK